MRIGHPGRASIWNRNSDSLDLLFLLVFVWGGSSHARRDGRTPDLRWSHIFGQRVLHELGHALVARGSGIPAKGIILLADRGITHPRRSARHPTRSRPGSATFAVAGRRAAGKSFIAVYPL